MDHGGSATYRSDIDGLRAFAILSVIAFHAFPGVVVSGFYGVDVFFVISGYLIGGIILRQLDQKRFRFWEFYARRVRRIFPALIVVLVATLIVGWFTLLPHEYVQLGQHVAASAAFISNFLLWTETGYFDVAAETKPLMHLWSLGIEEQFYIVWPLLLLVATRTARNPIPLMIALALLSFALMMATAQSDATAAFYLPIFRVWELMLGSIVAALEGRLFNIATPNHVAGRMRQGISAIGLAMILGAMMLPSDTHSAMTAWAILPTMGAVLAIAVGPSTWANKQVLSNRAMVLVGLVSYPLYLWHWPLLSFARIVRGDTPPLAWRLCAVAASLGLAVLTYRLVETPLRFGQHAKTKAIGLCFAMLAIGSVRYSYATTTS